MDSPTGELTVDLALNNLEQTEDPSLRYYAAWWLGKFRIKDTRAITALIAALQDDLDRTPDGGYPLRRNAARALGKLGQPEAVQPLVACLSCDDYYVREAASQALGELQDPACIPALRKLLEGGATDYEPLAGVAHLRQPYDSVIESLGNLGATAAIAADSELCPIADLEPFLSHPVPRIRYGAARALYQLTQNPRYGEQLIQALQEPDLQLRRSVLMDLGACGYVEAVEAIAQTPAENSLKLVALRGILEQVLAQQDPQTSPLSPTEIRIMKVMDSLL